MPPLDRKSAAIVRLFNLCRKSNTLPFAGPLMDQPEWLMDLFGEIETTIDREQKERQDDMKIEMEREKLRHSPEWQQLRKPR